MTYIFTSYRIDYCSIILSEADDLISIWVSSTEIKTFCSDELCELCFAEGLLPLVMECSGAKENIFEIMEST